MPKVPFVTDSSADDHLVQFYLTEAYLAGTVAEFLVEGLKAGEACIALSSAEHIAMIEKILATSFDLDALKRVGRWVTVDIDDAETWLVADGMPIANALRERVEPLLAVTAETGLKTRIFEDIVAVLSEKCKLDESFRLEQIWNDIQADYEFTLFCSYSSEALRSCEAHDYPQLVAEEHSQVVPDETYANVDSEDKRLRKRAFLELRNAELQAEIADFKAKTSRNRRSNN